MPKTTMGYAMRKKNSNRELIAVCSAYLHPSSAPLLHGNEALNGSMSTGRGSRRAVQLWTPTHETRVSSRSSGTHLRAWYLNGGGGQGGIVRDADITWRGGRKEGRGKKEEDNALLSFLCLPY